MTPAQCRAARALLDWTQQALAEGANVGNATIRNFEAGRSEPQRATLDVMRRALEQAGVEFIPENGGGAGVRIRRFRVGDRVKYRPETTRRPAEVGPDEVGTLTYVEPHPPQTGEGYRVSVQFDRRPVDGELHFELRFA